MKSSNFPLLALLCLAPFFLAAQVTNNLQLPTSINTDGAAPNASAMLDVSATKKGMLVTRMTSAQRTAIASPTTWQISFARGVAHITGHFSNRGGGGPS
jgi:hypothetical protein